MKNKIKRLNGFEFLELSERMIKAFKNHNEIEGQKLAIELLTRSGGRMTATGQWYFVDENGKKYTPCESGAKLYID